MEFFTFNQSSQHNKNKFDVGEQTIQIDKIIIHKEFNRRNLQNDICILKTNEMRLSEYKHLLVCSPGPTKLQYALAYETALKYTPNSITSPTKPT